MFLDGDAFPIADPMALIEESLAKAPLVAVRRAENVGDPQPHPCFCVTRVGTWRTLPGDWSGGFTWRGHRGKLVTDVGGNLLRALSWPSSSGCSSCAPIASTSTPCSSASTATSSTTTGQASAPVS